MIGIGLILLGCVSIYLAIIRLKDHRSRRNDFVPLDSISVSDVWLKRTLKVQRFSSILDIWIFGIGGPTSIALGLIALFRGD